MVSPAPTKCTRRRRTAHERPLEGARQPARLLLCAGVVASGLVLTTVGCRNGGNSDSAAASGPGGPITAVDGEHSGADAAGKQSAGSDISLAREFWFEAQLGQDAVLAREQGDDAIARKLLTQLVADPATSVRDAAGAHLLLALDASQSGRHTEAAQGFAKARSAALMPELDAELLTLQAQAHLAADAPAAAVEVLSTPGALTGIGPTAIARLEMLRAKANGLAGEVAVAREIYERVIVSQADEREADAARWALADLLVAQWTSQQDVGAQTRARQLLTQLQTQAEGDAARRKASVWLAKLDGPTGDSSGRTEGDSGQTAAVRPQSDVERHETSIVAAEGALSGRRYKQAARAMKRLLAKNRGLPDELVCRAQYVLGTSIFRQRDRAGSRSAFDAGAKACKSAGLPEMEVKCRFQAARATFAQGYYPDAAQALESLARDHSGHSYCDDALITAGEAWESAERVGDAQRVYLQVLREHTTGDMQADARRRLLLLAFIAGDNREVLRLVREGAKAPGESALSRAKLAYFEGRVLARLGQTAEAQQAYLRVLDLRPLSYPALQAVSRLKDMGESPWQAGVAKLTAAHKASKAVALGLPENETVARARIWASLGVGDRARAALGEGGIQGWPAAIVMAWAGAWSESQRRIAMIKGDWREAPPVGDNRHVWELAHPLPFFELVEPRERQRSMPALLTYAVMQTESRFDPGVTSWAGARGLMQLMPATAKGVAKNMGVRLDRNSLYRAETNISLGIHYLSSLIERRGGGDVASALAIPSYNAGSGSVARWLDERGNWDLDLFIEAIPFDETRRYTQSVLGRWMAYRWLYGEGEPEERVPFLPLEIGLPG